MCCEFWVYKAVLLSNCISLSNPQSIRTIEKCNHTQNHKIIYTGGMHSVRFTPRDCICAISVYGRGAIASVYLRRGVLIGGVNHPSPRGECEARFFRTSKMLPWPPSVVRRILPLTGPFFLSRALSSCIDATPI